MNPTSKQPDNFGLKMTLLLVGAAICFGFVWLLLGSFPTIGDVVSGMAARKSHVTTVDKVRGSLQVAVRQIDKVSPVLNGIMLLCGAAAVALPVRANVRGWVLGFGFFFALVTLAAWLTPVLAPWLTAKGVSA